MKLKIFISILVVGLISISFLSFSQIDSTRLIKTNRVKSLELFSRQIKSNGKLKKKSKLISKVEFNGKGLPILEIHFDSKGKEYFRHLYFYKPNDVLDSIIYIKENDTIISVNTEAIKQIKIITGGIPDYFPKYKYYKNGLLKSETVILGSGKETVFEYIYEYY